MPAPRLRWTLLAAALVHAGAYAWTAHVARQRALRASGAPPVTMEMDVEVEPPPPSTAAAPLEPEPNAPATPAPARSEPHRASPADAAGGAVGSRTPVATAPPAASSEPVAGDGSWTFSPTTGPSSSAPSTGPLGAVALNGAVRAGVEATLAEERKTDAARKPPVLPSFSARDVELGLAPGGALASLTRDLVRRSNVPTVAHAVLELDTDGAGLVASVRVLDVSSARADWEEVAAQIATEARAKPPLKVPAGAKGIALKVEVTSAMKTIDGATPATGAFAKAWGALKDPIGAATNGSPVRVVAARVLDVQAF